MKSILLVSFLAALFFGGVNDIATINRLKKEAAQAYQHGNFGEAITNYQMLIDSFKVDDEHIKLNLANAYFQTQDTSTAYNYYRQLLNSTDRQVKSAAFQQMGVIDDQKKNQKQALAYFKEALKANPTNEDARYNYELLKKTLKDQQQNQDQQQNKKDQEKNKQENKDQQKQDQQQQNEDQQKQDQQNQDQQQQGKKDQQQNKNEQQDQEKSDEKKDQEAQKNDQQQGEQEQSDENQKNDEPVNPTTAERLKEMNMSEEKARMILEAMRNNEQQYIQQIRRKSQKPVDRGKPDW